MLNSLKNLIKDKKIMVLGFGREGKSTLNILQKIGGYKLVAIADKNEIDCSNEFEKIVGEDYLSYIKNFDIVFKSPGVVLKKSINVGNAYITSEIDEFLKVYKNQVVGITGTKGKSTVSSLIYHILKDKYDDVIFAGNIGIPVFDVVDKINKNTKIVLELSCHQLEYSNYSPHIAILLNIYEEHLDHYDSFDDYANTKKNIYLNQNANDDLLTTKEVNVNLLDIKSKITYIDKNILPFNIDDAQNNTKLIGNHNLLNLAFAYAVSKKLRVSDAEFLDSIRKFKPLPHRLEFIGNFDGIDYYDDSISTAQESSIEAIKSVNSIDTILLGGMDRGINYDKLIYYIREGHVRNVICMYESGKRIYKILNTTTKKNFLLYYVEDLKQAVEKAKKVTDKNKACVLSPAAASYGYFKNFEERGDKFKELCKLN